MDLSKIITVSGKGGLFRVVAQGRNAIIAESLTDGKRTAVPSSVRVSSLDEIQMFTTGDDEPLKNILARLHEIEKGGSSVDPKGDEEAMWKKLLEALPTADRSRIYASDVRKLFSWYEQLLKAGEFAKKEEEKKEEGAEKPKEEAKAGKKAGAKPKVDVAKKGAPKSASAPKSAAPRRGGQRGA